MSETKKKKDGLVPKDEMKATGKGTGKKAKLSFQYDGKHHEKGEEILGLDAKALKECEEKGLVE